MNGNPLTVAGAATVSVPVGSSSPCSLLIPFTLGRGTVVTVLHRGHMGVKRAGSLINFQKSARKTFY